MRKQFAGILTAIAAAATCALAFPASASAHDDHHNPPGCGGGNGGCYTSLTGKSFDEDATHTYTTHHGSVTLPDAGVHFIDLAGQHNDPLKATLTDTGQTTGSQSLFEVYTSYTGAALKALDDDISVTLDFLDGSKKLQSYTVNGVLGYDSATGKADVTWAQNGLFTFDNLQIQLTGGDFDTTYDVRTPSFHGWKDNYVPAEVVKATFTLLPCTSGVPEPMTWAMMILGFFGLGAVLRAHRRSDRALRALEA